MFKAKQMLNEGDSTKSYTCLVNAIKSGNIEEIEKAQSNLIIKSIDEMDFGYNVMHGAFEEPSEIGLKTGQEYFGSSFIYLKDLVEVVNEQFSLTENDDHPGFCTTFHAYDDYKYASYLMGFETIFNDKMIFDAWCFLTKTYPQDLISLEQNMEAEERRNKMLYDKNVY